MAAEVVVPFDADAGPVQRVRSTVLLASLTSLREANQEAAWARLVDAEAREAIATAPAGVWLPVDVALAHYRAIDALELPAEEMAAIGRRVSERVSGTLLGTMADLARGAGVTPWTLYKHIQRFWNRAYDGGAIRVVRHAPKEAVLDMVKCPLVDVRYYRLSLLGHLQGMTSLFCKQAFVRELAGARAPGTVSYRAQWA